MTHYEDDNYEISMQEYVDACIDINFDSFIDSFEEKTGEEINKEKALLFLELYYSNAREALEGIEHKRRARININEKDPTRYNYGYLNEGDLISEIVDVYIENNYNE